ncbi:hypothetical protein [Deefgea rivuli]|uniref:hypothetical protein n=1 Tax=Deefgea rivuli TaxID=400948 RepID=UPI000482F2C0|nr:hypothetical protein [Deefgea rivuli]
MPQFPVLAPSAISPGSQSSNYDSKTQSGKSQTRKAGTTLLTFDVSWLKLTRAQAAPLWGFIQAQNGTFGRFDFLPALWGDSSNPNAPSTASVNATAAARQQTVLLGGLPINKTVLNAGDLIRFANHNKTYVLAADAVSNASGIATLTLAFDLIAVVPASTVATLKGVLVRCALAENAQNMPIAAPFFHDISVKLIETP